MTQTQDLISIGVTDIDELLGGGLRRGTTCLLEELKGESSGVTGILGFAFLLNGIEHGDGGVLLLSEHTVSEFRHLPGTMKIESTTKPGQFIFMDALSSMVYGEPTRDPDDEEENIVHCSNVRYAPKFYEELRTTVASLKNPIMYVDSLSILLNAMESDKAAWRFWLSLLPLIRYRSLTIVASFYPEMHSPAFVEGIERICDTIIAFTSYTKSGGQSARQLQVIKNRGFNFNEQMHAYSIEQFEFHLQKE